MRWNNLSNMLFGGMLILLLAACADSAASLNNQGNTAFQEEQYDQAMENYTSAKQEDASLPEPYYNSGNALHEQGDMEAAGLELQEALRANDDALAQKAFYNLGNTYFKQEDWMGAIDAYRRALLLDPHDQQAKYNLELALEQLFEQQNQQPPPQQQQGGENDQQQPNQGGGQQDQQPQQPQPGENEEEEGGGEEGENDQSGSGDQPQEQPSGGRELSEEEAEQLLDALGQDSQTLQERLQQQFGPPALPPAQDW